MGTMMSTETAPLPTGADVRLPRNCTFDPDDWAKLAGYWYPVALSRDVSYRPLAAKLLDAPLVVYRSGEQVVVADDLCPHRGVPLSMGSGDENGIVCAYHGLRFGRDGRCNRIPAQPQTNIPAKLNLRTYPAVERYGLVWTSLRAAYDAGDEVGGVPPMPHWDEPDFQQITCPTLDIFGFAGRQLEGFIDVAHFGFVHKDTFGDPGNTLVPPYHTVPTPDGFEAEYRSSVGNYPIGVDRGQPGFEWLRHFRVHLPFTATLEIHFPDDGRLVIMNAACPVSARVTRLFAPIARNFDKEMPVQAVYDFNQRVFEEDKAIVEAQKPENLPLNLTLEAHITADRSSVAYRRALRDRGFSRFFTS
jgi:phenylpropionate dioxygenase-like ring-hydroxylating dioxygenase large terminal subunit